MFLSSRILSKHNDALTTDTIKWMFRHALHMDQQDLYLLKSGDEQVHPLMAEESLYDDLPVEVLGFFVMEYYFPRKHFERAFSWLFGKNSIKEIVTDDFAHYQQLVNKNTAYTLKHSWENLPLTADEHTHIFNQFKNLGEGDEYRQVSACKDGLLKNASVSPETYNQELLDSVSTPNLNLNAEVANLHIDNRIARLKSCGKVAGSHMAVQRELTGHDLHSLENQLKLKNISRERRDALLAEFDVRAIGLIGVSIIYNKKIPSDAFKLIIENKLTDIREVNRAQDILSDEMFPKENATEIAFSNPVRFALSFLRRGDLDGDVRADFISLAIQKDADGGFNDVSSKVMPEVLSLLAYEGALSPSEISLIRELDCHISVHPSLHPFYNDPASFVDAVRALYSDDLTESLGASNKLNDIDLSDMLYSQHWTKELLLELLDVTTQAPAHLATNKSGSAKIISPTSQFTFRQNIYRKLFCESVYLSLEREDHAGRYGRAESILGRLLDRDPALLSQFDNDLIARAHLQLDYSDAEVNLATSLAQHPELNDRLMAAHLKRQLELRDDGPALVPSRSRPSI